MSCGEPIECTAKDLTSACLVQPTILRPNRPRALCPPCARYDGATPTARGVDQARTARGAPTAPSCR
eukprot:3707184-Prymnesium_polylepis.1